jgi:HD-GYP domain-containing protein (c-di-GMP phosphodiesterase class II)
MHSGHVEVVDDISAAVEMTPWREEALRRGYQSAIALPFTLVSDMTACLTLYSSKIEFWSSPERKLLQEISLDLSFGITALRAAAAKVQYEKSLRDSLEQTIQVIADTGEERDSYTAGHQRQVAALCTKIATELGLSPDRIHGLHLAASIHDLGKIGIPAAILTKPRALTEMEFGMIKEHTTIAFKILKDVNFPWPIANLIVQHHKRIDGSGYPMGLKEDDILLGPGFLL